MDDYVQHQNGKNTFDPDIKKMISDFTVSLSLISI